MVSSSSTLSSWRRLRQLSWHERWLVARVALTLPVVAAALHRRGLNAVQRRLTAGLPQDVTPPRDPEAAAVRLAHLVEVAARRGPWPANCLQRSVTLWWLLRRRGVDSQLRIGVRRSPDASGLDFHAWVELGDRVLNDRRDIRDQFAPFDRAIAPPSGAFD